MKIVKMRKIHEFEKTNLVTTPKGDKYKCKKCGIEGWREGLTDDIKITKGTEKLINECKGYVFKSIKIKLTKVLPIKEKTEIGQIFNTIEPSDKKFLNKEGVCIKIVKEEVRVLDKEYEEIKEEKKQIKLYSVVELADLGAIGNASLNLGKIEKAIVELQTELKGKGEISSFTKDEAKIIFEKAGYEKAYDRFRKKAGYEKVYDNFIKKAEKEKPIKLVEDKTEWEIHNKLLDENSLMSILSKTEANKLFEQGFIIFATSKDVRFKHKNEMLECLEKFDEKINFDENYKYFEQSISAIGKIDLYYSKEKVYNSKPNDISILEITNITIDENLQNRVQKTDLQVVEQYKESLNQNDKFPPIVVFKIDEEIKLVDGFHRYRAYKELGITRVEVKIIEGNYREATLYSLTEANSKHGVRKSTEDIIETIKKLLNDEEWKDWSEREIARRVVTTTYMVQKVKKMIEFIEPDVVKANRNGKVIEQKREKKPKSEKPIDEPSLPFEEIQKEKTENNDETKDEIENPPLPFEEPQNENKNDNLEEQYKEMDLEVELEKLKPKIKGIMKYNYEKIYGKTKANSIEIENGFLIAKKGNEIIETKSLLELEKDIENKLIIEMSKNDLLKIEYMDKKWYIEFLKENILHIATKEKTKLEALITILKKYEF